MSVRIIIVLLALPLFLLLAAANSLLLYQQEVDDVEQGLRGEALAAIAHPQFRDELMAAAERAAKGRSPVE